MTQRRLALPLLCLLVAAGLAPAHLAAQNCTATTPAWDLHGEHDDHHDGRDDLAAVAQRRRDRAHAAFHCDLRRRLRGRQWPFSDSEVEPRMDVADRRRCGDLDGGEHDRRRHGPRQQAGG